MSCLINTIMPRMISTRAAGVYDRVLNGDFEGDEVMDTLEEIRDWVTGCIFGK